MSLDELLGVLDLPEWLFAPLLLVGCALGLALCVGPTDALVVDAAGWLGAEVLALTLAWGLLPRRSFATVFEIGAMVLTAGIGSAVGGWRAATHGVDTIAGVGLVLGPVCALALVVGAARRRRRRR